jgi:hypothetical protein
VRSMDTFIDQSHNSMLLVDAANVWHLGLVGCVRGLLAVKAVRDGRIGMIGVVIVAKAGGVGRTGAAQ